MTNMRVFKKYSPGQREAVDLDITILVDTSGSMGSKDGPAALQMAHGIKVAMDDIGASCRIIKFSHECVMIEPATTKSARNKFPSGAFDGGGTEIAPALAQALKETKTSNARFKAVFALTDGDYGGVSITESGDSDVRYLLSELRRRGVYTALFYYNTNYRATPQEFLKSYTGERLTKDGWKFVGPAHNLHDIGTHISQTILKDVKDYLKKSR